MRIDSVYLKNFRCFSDEGCSISLSDFNCFIGPNSSGKTAALIALARMFGESSETKKVVQTDFHLEPGEKLADLQERKFAIECKIVFPELDINAEGSAIRTVPPTFNQMIVSEVGQTPYCRVILEGTWTNDGSPEGDIEQKIFWIRTTSDDPAAIELSKPQMNSRDRSRIRVVYISATRKPEQQIKATTGSGLARFLNEMLIEDKVSVLQSQLELLHNEINSIMGVTTLNDEIGASWNDFYDGNIANKFNLRAVEDDPAAVIRALAPSFHPSENDSQQPLELLSDGLKSLFSFSLPIGLHRLEETLYRSAVEKGFKASVLEKLPALTFFAIEEPENHLSPHYLGKVIEELRKTASGPNSQIALTSHSAAIVGRVEPTCIRYFRLDESSRRTDVRKITLPDEAGGEQYKFISQAVMAFPEIYFSKLVVLAEGESEEVVLKKLLRAGDKHLDENFISVVPLGGRHVSYFWRLLGDLNIPFVTLLDLDLGREGAGWGRIQYIRDELISLYGIGNARLEFKAEKGKKHKLNDKDWDELYKRDDNDLERMESWLDLFQSKYDVFFSKYLDLDLMMLESFGATYKKLEEGTTGPQIPQKNIDAFYKKKITRVLSDQFENAQKDGKAIYSQMEVEDFAWYCYLFLDRSKPATHMKALSCLTNEELVNDCPKVLTEMLARVEVILASMRS